MAVYRNVSLSFWTDSKVENDFTPEDKFFYLYLITNPQTNICGCYQIGRKTFEFQTGYTMDTVHRLLDRMQNIHNVIRYDRDTNEVLILNWRKYNWTGSDKLTAAVRKSAAGIKNPLFKEYVLRSIIDRDFSFEKLENDTVSIPYKYPMDTTTVSVSESDTVSDTVSVSQSRVSIPYQYPTDTVSATEKQERPEKRDGEREIPTLEQLKKYVEEKRLNVDADEIFEYYQNRNWMIRGEAIRNWRAVIDYCAMNNKKSSTVSYGQRSSRSRAGFEGRKYDYSQLEKQILEDDLAIPAY